MKDFWVASWLHCPPESQFTGGRRVIFKKLCFGPAEAQLWFVTEDGNIWHEERILEGTQEGERLLEPVSREDLLRLLEQELSLCQRLGCQEALLLIQEEAERWRKKS